jgi:predicted unusual protein kinase regulating ubiquinone biosynthesis (AarF/ABC1/UbiB family)
VSALAISRWLRTVRLLSLPVGALALGLEGVARRALGQDPEAVRRQLRARNAARTRAVLGELKGGALKAGQLLSTVEALFPQDPEATWRETLTGFQEGNPAVPFADLEPVLSAELSPAYGRGWRGALPQLDATPVAAASIGQVHRGRWHDGRDVAVKIQYPGVREALAADVRAVSVLSRVAALVARGLALPPLVTELRERLVEELDYLHEARVQRAFADAYRDDPDIVVPEVVAATPRVLVTTWLDGTPLARIAATGSVAERDRAGELYLRFLLSGPERAGWLHTDPHPGNFRLVDTQTLGVLDFGSALPMPGGLPATFGRLVTVLGRGDPEAVLAGLREEGFLRPGVHLEVDKLIDYLAPLTAPSRHETFHFTRDWLRGEFSRVNDPRNPEFGVALRLSLPPEHLFTHRVWLGIVGVLAQLDATVAIRAELTRWLVGFDPVQS